MARKKVQPERVDVIVPMGGNLFFEAKDAVIQSTVERDEDGSRIINVIVRVYGPISVRELITKKRRKAKK